MDGWMNEQRKTYGERKGGMGEGWGGWEYKVMNTSTDK
jgi:hypothetical protein